MLDIDAPGHQPIPQLHACDCAVTFRVERMLLQAGTAWSKVAGYGEPSSTGPDIPMGLLHEPLLAMSRGMRRAALLQYCAYPRRQREVVKLQETGEYDTHQQTMMLH